MYITYFLCDMYHLFHKYIVCHVYHVYHLHYLVLVRWLLCNTHFRFIAAFTEQRPLLVCEMLAVEVCEPTCPAAAEDEINFEDTALKEEEKKHMQMHRSNLPETHTKRKFHQICAP